MGRRSDDRDTDHAISPRHSPTRGNSAAQRNRRLAVAVIEFYDRTAIATINVYNRLMVATKQIAGA